MSALSLLRVDVGGETSAHMEIVGVDVVLSLGCAIDGCAALGRIVNKKRRSDGEPSRSMAHVVPCSFRWPNACDELHEYDVCRIC